MVTNGWKVAGYGNIKVPSRNGIWKKSKWPYPCVRIRYRKKGMAYSFINSKKTWYLFKKATAGNFGKGQKDGISKEPILMFSLD